MRRPHTPIPWLLVGMLLFAPSARAGGSLDVDMMWLGGNTSYRIDIWGTGASLLAFSLDGQFAGLSFTYPVTARTNIEGALWGRISADESTLEDSDWIYGDGHPGVDIFSVSDLTLDSAFLGSAGVAVTEPFKDGFPIDALLGYAHETLEFTGSNAKQIGYGPYWYDYTTSVPGPVIRYSVTYGLPYMGLRARLHPRLKLDVLFSPLVTARDRDDHLAREDEYPKGSGRFAEGKLAEGVATGTAWIIDFVAAIPVKTGSTPPPPSNRQVGKDITEWGTDIKEWTVRDGRLVPPQQPKVEWTVRDGRPVPPQQPAVETTPSVAWSAVFKVRHLSLTAQGTQRQWYYYPDGSTAQLASGIPLTLTSQQTALVAAMRIDF